MDSFTAGGAGNDGQIFRQSVWAADNFLFGAGRHALKIGGVFFFETARQISAFNRSGTFVFSNLRDFEIGKAALFSQSPEARNAGVSQWQTGAFVQDDIRLGKNFVLSAGLRYERQNNLRDGDNFSPRLSFAWSPFKNGKTTFRGGVGIFYNWLEAGNLLTILSQGSGQPGEVVVVNPNFPNPFSGTAGAASLVLPRSYWQTDKNLKNPYVVHSSFGVQNQLSRSIQMRVEYVFQKGVRQFRSRDINAPLAGVRPNAAFGRIVQIESSAFFVRNALEVGLSGRIFKDATVAVNYTLSKTVSDSGGIFVLPSDNYNLRADRAVADNDQRHKIFVAFGWKIKKGLSFNSSFAAASPLPYTVTTGTDDNGDTVFNDRPFGVNRNGERGTWRSRLDAGLSYTFSFVNRKSKDDSRSFSIVTTSDDTGAFDFNPEKRFSIRLFASARNLLNRTNLINFVGVETSPFFRRAIAAEDARKIVFGLRFNF